MDIKEAFEILELDLHSSPDVIKSKYKMLSKDYHPDKNGGYSSKMVDLNEARDIAFEFAKNKYLITVVNELSMVENKVLRRLQEIEREISAISNRAKKRIGNKLRSMKDMTGFLGLISGIATLIVSKVIPIIEFEENSLYPKIALLITVILGVYYLLFNTQIKRLEEKVVNFKDSLEEKEYFYNLFYEIVRNKKGTEIHKDEFLDLIIEWNDSTEKDKNKIYISTLPILGNYNSTKKISMLIGTHDFGKLILLKAEQYNFVVKSEKLSSNGFEVKYLIL